MSNILFVSPVKWGALKQRHQALAKELSEIGHKVFYVNPLLSGGFSSSAQEDAKISILSVKVPFKASAHPKIQKYAIKLALKLIIKKLHLKAAETTLWLAEPSCAEMALSNWNKIIYDCCDLHGNFPGQNISTWQYYESLLANKSDLITVSSPYIKRRFKEEFQHKCLLMPNATSYKAELKLKRGVEEGKIKLLSSGAHYEWVDFEWLKMLVESEDIELYIAGSGRGKAFEKLIRQKNVVYHNNLKQDALLKLMRNCHAGLVPFKNIELIKGVDPIKVYDYAALGLEIWATNVDSLKQNPYISSFISNENDLKTALEKLKKPLLQSNFTPVPTWRDRIKQIAHRLA